MQPLQVGVCHWSLNMPDLSQALTTVRQTLKLDLVQLGFWDDTYREVTRIQQLLEQNQLEVAATCLGFPGEDYSSIQRIAETGGFLPDNEWDQRFQRLKDFADFTQQIKCPYLLMHIGFVPHDVADPQYSIMVDRLQQVCDQLHQRNVTLIMETGQEKPADLLTFIDAVDRPNIAINLDPANMILYGVDEPLPAVDLLKERIVSCHMKDANWSSEPGQAWGDEVVLGTGQADIPAIVTRLKQINYQGPLVIEREAGDQRIEDIQTAIGLLQSLLK
jgi:sugar phosphate isomerase/epimerase